MRNKAITRGKKTFKEAVDYIIEQELRQTEFKLKRPEVKFCKNCNNGSHNTDECRANSNFKNTSRRESMSKIPTCYKCQKRGHYSHQCLTQINPTTSNTSKFERRPQFKTEQKQNFYPQNSRPFNSQNSPSLSNFRSEEMKKGGNLRILDSEILIEEAIACDKKTESKEKN